MNRTPTPTPTPAAHGPQPTASQSVRRQLFWSALGVIVVSGSLLALALDHLRRQALDAGQQLNESLAQVVEEQAAHAVDTVDRRLQFVAQGLALLDATGGLNAASAGALLRQQEALPYVRAIWVLDAAGRVAYASDPASIGLDLADRAYFQVYLKQPQTGFYLGAPIRSRTSGLWLIAAARPLPSAGGGFAGVVVAGIDPPYFERLWHALDLGEGGAVALFSRGGELLMRSPFLESAMGQSYGAKPLFSQALVAAPVGSYTGASPIDGQERLNAYRSVAAQPGLVVLVARTAGAVLAPWRQQALVAVGIWVAGASVIGLLFVALNQAMQRSMRADSRAQLMSERLVLATDAAAIGVWDWDVVADTWQASPTYYTMLGYPPEPDAGDRDRWLHIVHPDDRAAVEQKIRAVLAGSDQSYEYEARLRHADGSLRWVSVVGRVLERDAAARPTRLLGVRIDITERQQLMQQLQASEARFRAFFEQAAVGVAHVGLDGTFALVNQRFADITGRSRADLQACTFQQITHPEDLATDLDHVQRLQAGEIATYSIEKRYLRPDDSLVWVNLTVSMVRDATGVPLHFVSVVEDITARKRAEQQLLEQLTELRRWHSAMLGRELRTIEVKREVNALLAAAGKPPRYLLTEPSAAEQGH